VNVDIVLRQRTGWDDRPAERQTGAGSGFIWDDDGRIVTNYHVIADVARRPDLLTERVVLADRSAYEAAVVGSGVRQVGGVARQAAIGDEVQIEGAGAVFLVSLAAKNVFDLVQEV